MIHEPTSLPDIYEIAADLTPPNTASIEPAPGLRVRQILAEYSTTDVHHVLYLPQDWIPGRHYPVIVEYPGNGPYSNEYGDVCSGMVEECNLGFGISGGKGYIWVCLPFVDTVKNENRRQWWGNPDATASYAVACVREICRNWGGDPNAVFLSGFSRGCIACNFIGLRNDDVASLWRGFICHSHYEGVEPWDYPGSDRASALERLSRLAGRPQFISHEISIQITRQYLDEVCPDGDFTFMAIPFRNHTDTWVLRDLHERRAVRDWLSTIVLR